MKDHRTTAAGGMETSYGFASVGEEEKQGLVNTVFHKVAKRYDLMNDIMSGGMHRLWKDGLVNWLNPPRRAGWRVLDVAGGTGDIAFRIVKASGGNAQATVLDINGSMLGVGRERAEKMHLEGNVEFVEANAEELPFAEMSFDAYTIAFGIRNVPHIDKALAEAFRVLKPGGRFLCLGRRRTLSLSRRIDPQIPQPGEFRRDDADGRFRTRHLPKLFGRHCRAPFRLEDLTGRHR
jgi:demethylmenaquinone methyltransferase/2-methoxy-6-polyprenyl-1,4-benzoquinol methylase